MIKRVAVINDLSGLGKCSLTAAIPVLSVMGVQACPLPTAVLTNQTGYDSYYCTDFTDKIDHYTEEWQKRGLTLDAISTGYLGSADRAEKILNFCEKFRTPFHSALCRSGHGRFRVSNMTFSLPDSNSRCRSLYPMPM